MGYTLAYRLMRTRLRIVLHLMIEPELYKYRLPITTFMVGLPLWAFGTLVLTFVVVLVMGTDFLGAMKGGVAAMLGATPVFVAIAIIAGLTYPVRIHEDGVSSYDPWGSWTRDFLSWTDMQEIQHVGVLGIPYVRIDADGLKPLWIPYRAFRDPDLVAAVQQHAPASRLSGWMATDA